MVKKAIGVVGFGRTGKALLDFLLQAVNCRKIVLFNDFPIMDNKPKSRYESKGVEFAVGEKNFEQLGDTDMIILSPGVNARTDRFNRFRERGIKIVSEMEFASQFIRSKIVAITGTNGKSTTVSLIHHILIKNGIKSVLAGNIGKPLISEVFSLSEESIVVLEVSSFQLEEIEYFRPHIAVLLNITPDHLDRYPTFDDYFFSKLEIFRNQKNGDFMVLNYDDELVKRRMDKFHIARKSWFSTRSNDIDRGAFLDGETVHLRLKDCVGKVSLKKNPIRGIHNLENILASIITTGLLGVGVADIERYIEDFKGLPHRMEFVGKLGNVEFVNDSKATNVDATLKSIKSFNSNQVLILGGKDKGSDFKILETSIRERVKKVILVGEAANTISEQLINIKDKFDFARDFKEAVEKGYNYLKKDGGVVLLAPGCASFDMFENFEQRGDTFKEAFQKLECMELR